MSAVDGFIPWLKKFLLMKAERDIIKALLNRWIVTIEGAASRQQFF